MSETNEIFSFEQPGPELVCLHVAWCLHFALFLLIIWFENENFIHLEINMIFLQSVFCYFAFVSGSGAGLWAYTVNSRYLEIEGILKNTLKYPWYLDISDL